MKKFILILGSLLVISTKTLAMEDFSTFDQKIMDCSVALENEYTDCPETWSVKCYDKLMETNHTTQECYKKNSCRFVRKILWIILRCCCQKI